MIARKRADLAKKASIETRNRSFSWSVSAECYTDVI